jgi:hypothetical protein
VSKRRTGCPLGAIAAAAVALSACADGQANGPTALPGDGAITAESECRSLNGRLVSGTDRAVTIRAGDRQVSATLPGEAWCEVQFMQAGNMRQFVHTPPRVERRRAESNATPFDMHFVMIELALLPPGGSGAYPSAEIVRSGYADALRPGQGPAPGPGSGLTGLIRRGAKADVGAVDPATGCFPVTMDGDMPAPANRVRHFEMRSRVCVATAGAGAAATIQLLQEWGPGDRDVSARVQAYRGEAERLFASLRLGGAP